MIVWVKCRNQLTSADKETLETAYPRKNNRSKASKDKRLIEAKQSECRLGGAGNWTIHCDCSAKDRIYRNFDITGHCAKKDLTHAEKHYKADLKGTSASKDMWSKKNCSVSAGVNAIHQICTKGTTVCTTILMINGITITFNKDSIATVKISLGSKIYYRTRKQ